MTESVNPYDTTRQNYDEGVVWHTEKSEVYDWSNQIDRFARELTGNRVLDVGCGSGRDIQEFVDRGVEVEGIDYSGKTIKKCREKFHHVIFYEGDMRNMELPDGSYDGVWACASILNLKKNDVESALREFKRVLKSSGILFVSVKEGEGERIVPDQAGQRFFSFFSLQEIKEIIEAVGFKILHDEIISDSDLTGQPPDKSKPSWICLHATAT